MTNGRALLRLTTVLALLLSACGSSGPGAASTQAPADTSAASSSSLDLATDSAAPESLPVADGAGGTFAGKACDLLTTSEVESATQQTGITASEVAKSDTGGSAACGYIVKGLAPIVVLTVLDPQNTSVDLSTYTSIPGAASIDVGNGAQAAFVPTVGAMFVFKHGAAVSIQVVAPAPGEELIQTATKVAKAVAARLS